MDRIGDQAKFRPPLISCSAGLVVALLGAVVLIGWVSGIESLRIVLPGLAPMRPNAAAGFVLAGVSLCLSVGVRPSPSVQWVVRATAIVILLLGGLTLSEHLFGWDLRIDELLVLMSADPSEIAHPGRMSAVAATSFILLGSALLFLDRRSYSAAQGFGLIIMSISLVVLAGYLFGLVTPPTPGIDVPTAIHVALGFLLLSLGLVGPTAATGVLGYIEAQLPEVVFFGTLFLLGLAGAASIADTQRMADTAAELDETHNVLAGLNNVSLGVERVVAI